MTRATMAAGDRSSGSTEQQPCALCGRVTRQGVTEHHLIPRTCHSNKWFKKNFTRDEMQRTAAVCGDCHGAIHRLIPDEKKLGRDYNTVDKLLGHEQIARYVAWIKKQK